MQVYRLVAAVVAAAFTMGPTSAAHARAFEVEDLLSQATFGVADIDPSGRWLVYESRRPYIQGKRFVQGEWNGRALSRLSVVDLKGDEPLAPRLLSPETGLVAGPFSPSGGRLAVFRLADQRFQLGVADLKRGSVQFLDVTPLQPDYGRTVAWLSEQTLLVLARSDGQAPEGARRGWVAAETLPRLWATAAAGRSAHVVLGSGVYANVRSRPPAMQLLRIDTRNGATELLAEGPYVDFEISPDRTHVALLSKGADLQVRGEQPVRGEAGSETEQHHLDVLNLRSGTRRSVCTACDFLPQLLSWAPDSARLLVFRRRPGQLWTNGRLGVLDLQTSELREIGKGVRPDLDLNPVRVWVDWMGRDPVLFGRADDGSHRSDWFRLSSAGPINLTRSLPPPDKMFRIGDADTFRVAADGGLWAVDRNGGGRRRLATASRGALAVDANLARSRQGRGPFQRLWLHVTEGGTPRLALLSRRGLQVLRTPEGEPPLAAVSSDGRALLWRDVSPAGVERLVLSEAGSAPKLVAELNAEQGDTEAPEVIAIPHRGLNGEPLKSWLYLPKAVGARPPPLLVRPYLGANYPHAVVDRPADQGFMINLRVLTSHGYAVLIPSLPNPPGGMTDPARGLAGRILAVIDAAAANPAARGRFDADRLGLIGFSFGGYSVMTTITQTHRFKAAVSISGVSDFVSYWASQSPFAYLDPASGYVGNRMTGLVESTQPRLQAPPWREPDRYARNSPLLVADRIETPLLLIHGALDPIPHHGSAAMYSALFRQRKDAMLVTYWGALHGLASPGDVRDMYARIFAFFDARLVNGDPPRASPAPASASIVPTIPSRAR